MAVQFPDPNVTTSYVNPNTGEEYQWNPISGGWRRVSAGGVSGGDLPDTSNPDKQPGTLDDRYVNLNGDTMTGALVQHPSANTAPGGTGNLATNTPSNTQLEFRYQGSDDTVRCVTLPLGCCQTVTKRTEIGVSGTTQGTAEEGDVLEITDHAVISPSATIEETQWERETATGSLVFEDISGATGQTYTVTADDVGKRIRVREVFLKGQECEKVVRSNVVVILGQAAPGDPPIPRGLMFEWSAGATLKLNIGRSDATGNTIIHKLNSVTGIYEEHEVVPFYTYEVTYTGSDDTYGHYIVEDEGVNYFAFYGSSEDTEIVLDERSYMDNLVYVNQMFEGLKTYNQDLDWWDTSNVKNMAGMFTEAAVFNQSIGSWNTSNVTNMHAMFSQAYAFNQDISGWDTSNVTHLSSMFSDGGAFNQDIGGWNTSNVTNMALMFSKATVFNQDIGGWNTTNVTNTAFMFSNARSFDQSIGGWDTSNVTNMAFMFANSHQFNQSLGSWDTSNVTYMYGTFLNAHKFNKDIDNWNTSKVTRMDALFSYAYEFNRDIGGWNTSNVIKMEYMFSMAQAFNQDLSDWDTSKVNSMYAMFQHALVFNRDISSWCVPLISSKPHEFDLETPAGFINTPERQPQWGTCPPKVLSNPVIQ